jgi:hypothetical protein
VILFNDHPTAMHCQGAGAVRYVDGIVWRRGNAAAPAEVSNVDRADISWAPAAVAVAEQAAVAAAGSLEAVAGATVLYAAADVAWAARPVELDAQLSAYSPAEAGSNQPACPLPYRYVDVR